MFEVISFNRVNFCYDETPVLKNISFTVRPFELIHLIGPNGGGKTTLLKLLLGFLSPQSGSVKLFGKTPRKVSEKVAYVPQTFEHDRQFPISVYEVVLSGRAAHLPWHGFYKKIDKEKALSALEKVGLLHLKNRSIGDLSGGQLQRVLIARALATDPELLILDEPTSCVDIQGQIEIQSLLSELKRSMTILVVTHDLDHIGKETDRVFCVHGTLTQIRPDEVCKHFSMGLYQKPCSEPKKKLGAFI